MLQRDYNLRKSEDCRELLQNNLFSSLLGMVYLHNSLSSKIGYLINGRHELRTEEELRVEAMTALRKSIYQDLSKYCRVIGYTAKLEMDSRVSALRTRATGELSPASPFPYRHRRRSRRPGSITGINQKSLFIFQSEDVARQARDIIVDLIMTDDTSVCDHTGGTEDQAE